VSPSVENVHWLTPKSQVVAKQLYDGEVSSSNHVHAKKPNRGSQ
jgi:hypothetical protein